MAADSREHDAVRARLARVGPVPVGWVPGPPRVADGGGRAVGEGLAGVGDEQVADADETSGDAPGPSADGAAARHALAAAMASYTAAHGHPLEADELDPPGRFRLRTPARVAVAGLLGLLLVAGVVAVRAAQQTPSRHVPLPDAVGSAPAEPTTGATGTHQASAAEAVVVVHVVGAVATPGVVRLPVGARVADAVAAAGGATAEAELAAVNLARLLGDGEQVVVPVPGEVTAAVGAAGGGGPPALLDLNSADVTALDALPGIGPVLAERIVAWRERHGRFTAVAELTEVTGIGPSLLAGVQDLVRVG